MATSREVKEGRQKQGAEESIAYTVTTTPWGSSPTSIVVKVWDVTKGKRADVTSTVMPTNSPAAVGDVITLSPLKLLTPGRTYRVEVKFTASGNVFEPYFFVEAEH